MVKSIVELLDKHGPMLSGQLAKIYEQENHANNANARKAISRARSPVQKNKLLSFQNNQVFLYLEKQYMSQQYWDSLIACIFEFSKSTATFILPLMQQGGIMSKEVLPAYVMSPTENLTGHKRYDIMYDKLEKSKIITDYDDDYVQLSQTYFSRTQTFNFSRAKAIELSKKLVLTDFYDMLRKTNVISYNNGRLWSNFAKFQWAFTAPSYLYGISKWDTKKQSFNPGFIIADIVLLKNISLNDVMFFIEKVNIIKSYKNIQNFIPVLIVDSLNPDVFDYLKSQSIAIAFIDRLFGDRYKLLLEDLVNVMTNATAMVLNNPQKVDQIFDNLLKEDGRYNNIVGDLFELLVAELYRNIGVNYLEINKQVPAHQTKSGKPKEIDVLADKNGIIYIIECKATKSMIDETFVEKWLSEKIVDIHTYLTTIYSGKRFEFQLWSIGGFTSTALDLLEKAKQSTEKYRIDYFNKSRMLSFAKDNNVVSFTQRIKKHFA